MSALSGISADLLVGIIGVVLGLLLGLGVDLVRARRAEAKKDRRLLQALVDRLAGKRALNPKRDREGRFDEGDASRCTESVLDARQLILRVCESLSVNDSAMPALRQMEADCLAYLNFIERQPRDYVAALIALSRRLWVCEQQLLTVAKGLRLEHPGSRDQRQPAWLTNQEAAD